MTDETIILSYTPTVSPMKLDIMVGDYYRETVNIPCSVGEEYKYEDLRSMVRILRPSLGKVDFDLLPCNKPKFRK